MSSLRSSQDFLWGILCVLWRPFWSSCSIESHCPCSLFAPCLHAGCWGGLWPSWSCLDGFCDSHRCRVFFFLGRGWFDLLRIHLDGLRPPLACLCHFAVACIDDILAFITLDEWLGFCLSCRILGILSVIDGIKEFSDIFHVLTINYKLPPTTLQELSEGLIFCIETAKFHLIAEC